MIFTFVLAILATFWVWEFINEYIPLPGWASYVIVGLMAYGLIHVMIPILMSMAIAAVVGILHRLVTRPTVQVPARKNRTALPPLP